MPTDIIIIKADRDASTLDDVGRTNALGQAKDVTGALEASFPGMHWSTPASGLWCGGASSVEVALGDTEEVRSLHLSIHQGVRWTRRSEAVVLGALAHLCVSRGWSVFDVSTNDVVALPAEPRPARAKARSLTLREATTLEQVPGVIETPWRRHTYVAAGPNADILVVFNRVMGLARELTTSTEGQAIGESGARITLPDGTLLQGVTYKPEHSSVAVAVEAYSERYRALTGYIAGSNLMLSSGATVRLSTCKIALY